MSESWKASGGHIALMIKTSRNCHFKPDNLMVLEVREEILRAQVNNKWCDAQRLAIGADIVRKIPTVEKKSREREANLVLMSQNLVKPKASFIFLLFQL